MASDAGEAESEALAAFQAAEQQQDKDKAAKGFGKGSKGKGKGKASASAEADEAPVDVAQLPDESLDTIVNIFRQREAEEWPKFMAFSSEWEKLGPRVFARCAFPSCCLRHATSRTTLVAEEGRGRCVALR